MFGAGFLKDFAQNLMGFHGAENATAERLWQAGFAGAKFF
jgi:hypothetical protein